MRRYETVWVVHGDLPDEDVKSAVDKFTRIITAQGGVLVNVDEWGRRKLAYRIGGTTRGYYVLADFAGEPAAVKELERNFRIDDRIIRYLTVKKADTVNLEALESEIAARAAKAPTAPPVPEGAETAAEPAPEEIPVAAPPPSEAPPAVEAAPVDVAPASQEKEE